MIISKIRLWFYGMGMLLALLASALLWHQGYFHYWMALSGDPARQYTYGRWLDAHERKQEALMWMEMAAEYEPQAMFWLGMAYQKGSGYFLEGSKNASFDLMWAASDRRNAPAMLALAAMFEHRQIPMDLLPQGDAKLNTMALVWYMRAANYGVGPAIDRLVTVYEKGELGQKMSEEDARVWRETPRKPEEYWKHIME